MIETDEGLVLRLNEIRAKLAKDFNLEPDSPAYSLMKVATYEGLTVGVFYTLKKFREEFVNGIPTEGIKRLRETR